MTAGCGKGSSSDKFAAFLSVSSPNPEIDELGGGKKLQSEFLSNDDCDTVVFKGTEAMVATVWRCALTSAGAWRAFACSTYLFTIACACTARPAWQCVGTDPKSLVNC